MNLGGAEWGRKYLWYVLLAANALHYSLIESIAEGVFLHSFNFLHFLFFILSLIPILIIDRADLVFGFLQSRLQCHLNCRSCSGLHSTHCLLSRCC